MKLAMATTNAAKAALQLALRHRTRQDDAAGGAQAAGRQEDQHHRPVNRHAAQIAREPRGGISM
jgi:hypothetical protein